MGWCIWWVSLRTIKKIFRNLNWIKLVYIILRITEPKSTGNKKTLQNYGYICGIASLPFLEHSVYSIDYGKPHIQYFYLKSENK